MNTYRTLAFLGAVAVTIALIAIGTQEKKEIVFNQLAYHVEKQALEATDVSGEAWVMFDAQSGEILGGKNMSKQLPIASVTKLITADTALNNLHNLDSTTTVSWRAVGTEGTSGELFGNEKIQARELLFPLLLESSNDAAEALAEHATRDAFLKQMNSRVKELGMASTSLSDPSGLSVKNVSTANDLRVLVQHLELHEKHILDITRLSSFVGAAHVWQNNDPVYTIDGFEGGKQGFTDEAGRTFSGVFSEHFSSGLVRPIGIVLLGSHHLRADIASLRSALHSHVSYGYVVK